MGNFYSTRNKEEININSSTSPKQDNPLAPHFSLDNLNTAENHYYASQLLNYR